MGISEISFGGQKGERSIIKTNKCKVSIQHCFYYFVSDNHASIYTVLIYIQKITNLPKYLSQCDLKTESEFTQKIKIHSTFFVSFRHFFLLSPLQYQFFTVLCTHLKMFVLLTGIGTIKWVYNIVL